MINATVFKFFHNSYLFLQVRFNTFHPPTVALTAMASVFLWSFYSGSITSSSTCLHDCWFGKLYNLLVTTCFILLSRIYFSDRGGNCKRSIHVDNMPFSVGFYYCIKRKRLVYIEILNLGLERDLKFFSLYASKRALTSTSTFSFPYTLIPCFYMLDNGH